MEIGVVMFAAGFVLGLIAFGLFILFVLWMGGA